MGPIQVGRANEVGGFEFVGILGGMTESAGHEGRAEAGVFQIFEDLVEKAVTVCQALS